MRVLKLRGAQAAGFNLVEVPVPAPKAGEVLLKVLAASLCGTDLKVCKWYVLHTWLRVL